MILILAFWILVVAAITDSAFWWGSFWTLAFMVFVQIHASQREGVSHVRPRSRHSRR